MKKALWLWGCLVLGLAASFAQERFRKVPPIPDPLPQLNLPEIESMRLSNGLTVAVAEIKGAPFISLELLILAGESSSPENLAGLAAFTAELTSRGTTLLSASDLEERIESIGGNFSTTTAIDFSRFSFLFLGEYLDQALEILSLMMLQPALSEREIVNQRRTQMYDLRRRLGDPEFIGRRQLLRVLFKDHFYQRSLYNEDVFKNITRKDVQAFYDRFYRPNNAILVLAGNINLTAAVRRVSRFFGAWPRQDLENPLLPAPPPNREDNICLVDFPETKNAILCIGNVIFPLADPDYFPFSVLNQVLGGTPNSRLFMNLRESKEYAYYAFSTMDFFRSCGVYAVRATVVPSAVAASVREILKELETISRDKVSTFELEQAKSYLIGNFPLQISRLDQISRRVSDIVAFSLGNAHWSRFYDNIIGVDSDRVFEVAQKYLQAKPVVVIVGDQDNLIDHLREFERVDVYDIKGAHLNTITKGVEE